MRIKTRVLYLRRSWIHHRATESWSFCISDLHDMTSFEVIVAAIELEAYFEWFRNVDGRHVFFLDNHLRNIADEDSARSSC